MFLVLGISYSIYDYDGITTISQLLELGIIAEYLIGGYLLAKENPNGWIWYMIMNFSTFCLMAMQAKYIMAGQQLISQYFVIAGYIKARKKGEEDE